MNRQSLYTGITILFLVVSASVSNAQIPTPALVGYWQNWNAPGNSSEAIFYMEIDKHPLDGKSYCRVKQMDFDGRYSRSEIAAVEILNDGFTEKPLAYPNPVNEVLYLNADLRTEGILSIQLSDSRGQIVMESFGAEMEEVSTSDLSKGLYYLLIRTKTEGLLSEAIVIMH